MLLHFAHNYFCIIYQTGRLRVENDKNLVRIEAINNKCKNKVGQRDSKQTSEQTAGGQEETVVFSALAIVIYVISPSTGGRRAEEPKG